MLDRIVVALDGSEIAAAALPLVELLAGRLASEIVVLRVHDTRLGGARDEPGESRADEKAEAERFVADVSDTLRAQGLRARGVVLEGTPAETITRFGESAASVIAMASHGLSGVSRWALGSVAEKVLRTSRVPLLLVRAFAKEAPTQALRQIVVPVDGSARALAVVPWVAAIAKPFDAAVRVVHFVSDYAKKGAMLAGERHLEEARDAFAREGVTVALDIRRGDPAMGIAEYGLLDAGRDAPDLVAMSTHGRSGARRILLGSVAERVLRAATTPLFVLPNA